MSERDGWNHLYLYDGVTGAVKQQITKGEWVVRNVLGVDEDKRQIWFSASGMYPGKDPYFVHYYRINFDGTGLTTYTPADANHVVMFSSDRSYYVDTYSRVDLGNCVRAAARHRCVIGNRAGDSGYRGAQEGRLEAARSLRGKGPRRQDRHLGRHLPADELRSQARSTR